MRATLAFLIWLAALPAGAQGWGDLDGLLQTALAPGEELVTNGYWLPDSADPAAAREAVGIVYPVIVGAAGNFNIVVGYFTRQPGGWVLARRLENLFGTEPRDSAFLPDRIELTTTTLREGDPRCCPTGQTRWAIDRSTFAVRKLP